MRIRTKKWVSPLFIISLAVAGIFGVTAGVVDNQKEETPIIEEAKAEETEAAAYRRQTFWLDYSNYGDDFEPYISFELNDGTWVHKKAMTTIWRKKIAWYNISYSNYKTVLFSHTANWGANNCQTNDVKFVYESPAVNNKCVKNYYTLDAKPSDPNTKISGTWSYNTGLKNLIKFYKNNSYASGTMSDMTAELDDCTIPESTFVWEGYHVDFWATLPSYSGSFYYSGQSYTYSTFPSMIDYPLNPSSDEVIKLYAHWVKNETYTITYDRNKSTGLQATQDKEYGVNVEAYTPGTTPLTDSGWNPSAFKRFDHWNTKYDDSGDRVDAGSTITSNASFYLYYIEDWYDYRYKVDDGSWVNLVHNDAGKGEGIMVQFAPSSAQVLPENGKLYFEYSTDKGTNWNAINSEYITFEGNYDTTNGIKVNTSDTIYLKITDGGDYQCWVPGESERRAAVFDSPTATTGGIQYAMTGHGESEAITIEEVYIEKGQYIRRGYNDNYSYETWYVGGTESAALCFKQYGDGVCVECLITGVYTIYNQRGSMGNWADLYFTRNEAASAKALAQKFNSIVAAVCTDITSGSKSLSDLQAIWGSNSTTELYKHFNGQITATMDYFKTTSTTEDPDIIACVEKYDYIENKYGTTALPDFIGRNNGYKEAASNVNPFKLVNGNDGDNMTMILIIVTSSISLLSIAALSVLVIRKKER